MRDITDKTEDLSFKVTTELGITKDRRAQITITSCEGEYKQQLEMAEGEVTWVMIPLKLVDGQIVTG